MHVRFGDVFAAVFNWRI